VGLGTLKKPFAEAEGFFSSRKVEKKVAIAIGYTWVKAKAA
jgi:hypothetical protein